MNSADLTLIDEFRQRRQDCHRDRRADDRFRHLLDGPAQVERSYSRCSEMRRQVIACHEISLDASHREHAWPEQDQHPLHSRAPDLECRCPVELVADQPRHLDQQVQHRAQYHAVYDSVKPKPERRQLDWTLGAAPSPG